jgi:hypothetical protein
MTARLEPDECRVKRFHQSQAEKLLFLQVFFILAGYTLRLAWLDAS